MDLKEGTLSAFEKLLDLYNDTKDAHGFAKGLVEALSFLSPEEMEEVIEAFVDLIPGINDVSEEEYPLIDDDEYDYEYEYEDEYDSFEDEYEDDDGSFENEYIDDIPNIEDDNYYEGETKYKPYVSRFDEKECPDDPRSVKSCWRQTSEPKEYAAKYKGVWNRFKGENAKDYAKAYEKGGNDAVAKLKKKKGHVDKPKTDAEIQKAIDDAKRWV